MPGGEIRPRIVAPRTGPAVSNSCKGYGICAEECPCGAITMEPEET